MSQSKCWTNIYYLNSFLKLSVIIYFMEVLRLYVNGICLFFFFVDVFRLFYKAQSCFFVFLTTSMMRMMPQCVIKNHYSDDTRRKRWSTFLDKMSTKIFIGQGICICLYILAMVNPESTTHIRASPREINSGLNISRWHKSQRMCKNCGMPTHYSP